jgi:hypothetical protein
MFGGMGHRFDPIIPPSKLVYVSMGSMKLVPISVLKVG